MKYSTMITPNIVSYGSTIAVGSWSQLLPVGLFQSILASPIRCCFHILILGTVLDQVRGTTAEYTGGSEYIGAVIRRNPFGLDLRGKHAYDDYSDNWWDVHTRHWGSVIMLFTAFADLSEQREDCSLRDDGSRATSATRCCPSYGLLGTFSSI